MAINNGDVTVDRNFLRVGSKSYAVDKIGSIDIRTRRVEGSKLYLGLWVGAAACVLFGLNPFRLDLLALAAVLAAAGYAQRDKAKTVVFHSLVLLTTAGETQAFESTDGEQIRHIRDAIEAAMIERE